MIPGRKFQNALRALSHVLVLARKMAYDGARHEDIAEYLPRLLAANEDRSDTFRECLANLAQRWPAFESALQYFDEPNLPAPW